MKFQRDPILTIGVVSSTQEMFRAWRSEFCYPGPSMRFMRVDPRNLNLKIRYDALIVLPCCYEEFNLVELEEAITELKQNRFRASLLEFEEIEVPFGSKVPQDDPVFLARTDTAEGRAEFNAQRIAKGQGEPHIVPEPPEGPSGSRGRQNPAIRPEDAADPAGDPPRPERPTP